MASPEAAVPTWRGWLEELRWRRAAVAVAVVLAVFDALALLAGEAPRSLLGRALTGTWGTGYGVGQVLYKATPLLLAGLGFRVALRAGLFNIGVEGQLVLGSLAAGVVGAALPATTPWPLGVPLVVGAAALAGGSLGALAGSLRARFGVHEVIATLLLNRVVEALVPYLLQHGAGASGYRTADAVVGARLPRLNSFAPLATTLGGSAVSLAAPLALVVVVATLRWQQRSTAGRELRWVGLGPDACAAQGVAVGLRWVLALTVSGALTALGAAATVSGYKGYFEVGLGSGAGFGGIAVAMLGGDSGLGLVAAALLLATLAQAGLVLNASLPREAMDVLTATVLIAASAGRRRP